jgi:dihydroorotase-like cyclic amidohydrolase
LCGRLAAATGRVRALPMAALTRGCEGREISEFGLLKEAGAVAFFDGSQSVRNALVMRRALTYARDFDALIVHFAQDAELAGDGVMNEGEFALRLVHSSDVPLTKLPHAMSTRPAQLLGLEQRRLQKGAPADIIRFDPDEPFVVEGAKLLSRCKNTPFDEARMQGVVKLTVVGGEVVYEG